MGVESGGASPSGQALVYDFLRIGRTENRAISRMCSEKTVRVDHFTTVHSHLKVNVP